MNKQTVCMIAIFSIIIIALNSVWILHDLTGGPDQFTKDVDNYSHGDRMKIGFFALSIMALLLLHIAYLFVFLFNLGEYEPEEEDLRYGRTDRKS